MPSHGPIGQNPDAASARADAARFLRIVTHDLRQPIAATRTLASVLTGGYAGPLLPAQADLVARLGRRLEFMQALVDDLIDLATATLGPAADGAPVRAPLGGALAEACGRAEEAARQASVTVRCEASEDLPALEANATDLALLFDALLDNAVTYSPGGQVTVSLERDGGGARLVVADTGIGIPDEARPYVFEALFRASNAKEIDPQGTGLGLAVARAVTDRCGFTLDIESAEGRGTTVTVKVPPPRL